MVKSLAPELSFVELTTLSGETVVTPLAFTHVASLERSAQPMATRLAEAIAKHLIDDGRYLEALQIAAEAGGFERCEIVVDFPAGKDPLVKPALQSRHVAFVAAPPNQRALGYVPALGIVAMADGPELMDKLVEAIRLEHRRNARHTDIRRHVASQWFEGIELVRHAVPMAFPSPEERRRLSEQQTQSLLESVADALVAPAAQAAFHLEGSLRELDRAAEGAFARSVLLVGHEGSGKSTLLREYLRGLQHRAPQGALWETSAARLIQGLTQTGGGWQHPLAVLCGEIARRDAILCVGHLAELFEVGQYEGNAISLGDALREPLARGRLMLIAEATPSELARIELRSPGFASLFQHVQLPEMGDADIERTVLAAVAALAAQHRVSVEPAAVAEAVALQRRFSPYSGFPGKSIRFFESLVLQAREHTPRIGRDQALEAFCAETGMPRGMIDPRLALDLAEVDGFFRKRLFGQPDAIDVVVGTLAAIKTGLARTGKPMASMLLIGPTGVGKTETAKALAEFMFGDARRLVRLDMSEYADPVAVLRLLGDLGQREGVLVGAVRRQPFSVVLFDEIEKAHPSFFDLLLQVLGEGRLTGGDGLTANFCGTVVVMTSNLGAEAMQRAPVGMVSHRDDPRRHFEKAVQDALRPELFNRIDHIVPFAPLSAADRAPIFEREIGLVRRREGVLERSIALELDAGVPARLAGLPGDPRYGARDVQRVLRRQLVLPLAHALAPHPHAQPVRVRVAGRAEGEGGGDAAGALSVRSEVLQRPVETAPLRLCETLADGRRQWRRVVEGPMYVNLLNQLFRLGEAQRAHEKQRRKRPQLPHWDGTEDAARQRRLSGLRQEAEALFTEAMNLERDALLALLGEAPVPERAVAWEPAFLALKQNVFHAMRPDSGVCTVGLYTGAQWMDALRDAWCELAGHAGLEVKLRVVRLPDEQAPRPRPPRMAAGAEGRSEPTDGDEDGEDEDEAQLLWQQSELGPYLLFPWPQTEGKLTPVVGFEIELRGPAVYDLFRGESGVWRFHDDTRHHDAWVAVANVPLEAFRAPPMVHRQHFFDERRVHRQWKKGVLSDPDASWSCPFPHVNEWKLVLDQAFGQRLDRMLLGEDE